MKVFEAVSGGHKMRLYVNKVKAIFAFSILVHLSCVVGFDLCMHNTMPGQLSIGDNRTKHIPTLNSAQLHDAPAKRKNYEPVLGESSVWKGMDTGGRLLRPVSTSQQAK